MKLYQYIQHFNL